MIKVYDHLNTPVWADAYRKYFLKTKRTNGAYTYSQEIVKHHIPAISELFNSKKAIIMTVGNPYDLDEKDYKGYDLIINYLHERLERDICRVEKNSKLPIKIIYVTGRKNVKETLDARKIPCVYLPMSVDKKYIQSNSIQCGRYTDRVIFFGNAYFGKRNTFNSLKHFFNNKGWKIDSIYNNIYFKQDERPLKVKRENIFKILSKYKYGIGNGRCALEMYTLGLKVFISGEFFGGIITNDKEYEAQEAVNFAAAGDYTFNNDYEICFSNIDKSINRVLDVSEAALILKKEIQKFI